MRPSQVFIAVFVFLAAFTGGAQFLNSLYDNHNVADNTSVSVNQEYTDMKKSVGIGEYQNRSDSLYYRLKNPKDYTGVNLVDQAVAGLHVVPKFISVLLEPINIIDSLITGLQNEFTFIPSWIFTLVRGVFYLMVLYGIMGLLIGMRS